MSESTSTYEPSGLRTADPSLVTYTHVIYALHALSAVIRLTGLGAPYWDANARGTLLESHFRWQIRTFWLALLWIVVAGVVSAPLVLLLGLGVLTFFLAAAAIGLWVIYRVARGWLALRDGRAMPLP